VNGPWDNDTMTYDYSNLDQYRRIDVIRQGGDTVSYLYDTFLRLEKMRLGTNDHTYGYSGGNPLVRSLTRPNQSVTSYQYDDLNRLTDLQTRDSESTLINRFQYAYNSEDPRYRDLRSRETVTNGLPLPTPEQALTTYESNNVNQLTSKANPAQTFTYDNDGNLTQGYTPEGILYSASYDAEDRLKNIEFTGPDTKVYKTEYTYRWDGMLAVEKKYENAVLTKTTRFVLDGMLPIQERDANNAVTREYTWGLNLGGGIGGLLQMKQDGSAYSYLYDGKGNVSALIDSAQQVVAKYRYDVYGNLQAEVGTVSQPYLFSTKRYDYHLGTYYYGYRFYSPSTGRWLTRDPLGEAGGLNLYGFVGNDPVNYVDAFGLHRIVVCTDTKEVQVLDDSGKTVFREDAVTGCPGHETPEGSFQAGNWVSDKTNPKYRPKPWSRDMSNPYGPWFLPINNQSGKYTGYGIHGTAGPGWSPFVKPPFSELWSAEDDFLYCSHGCVRLANPDIDTLHDFLPNPNGTPIIIKKCTR
jgi:RHS repeat-associated protein